MIARGCVGGYIKEVDEAINEHHEGFFSSDETVLFCDCINANILVLILHYSFARC